MGVCVLMNKTVDPGVRMVLPVAVSFGLLAGRTAGAERSGPGGRAVCATARLTGDGPGSSFSPADAAGLPAWSRRAALSKPGHDGAQPSAAETTPAEPSSNTSAVTPAQQRIPGEEPAGRTNTQAGPNLHPVRMDGDPTFDLLDRRRVRDASPGPTRSGDRRPGLTGIVPDQRRSAEADAPASATPRADSMRERRPVTIAEVSWHRICDGVAFDEVRRSHYSARGGGNEVKLENGKVLDSYIPRRRLSRASTPNSPRSRRAQRSSTYARSTASTTPTWSSRTPRVTAPNCQTKSARSSRDNPFWRYRLRPRTCQRRCSTRQNNVDHIRDTNGKIYKLS